MATPRKRPAKKSQPGRRHNDGRHADDPKPTDRQHDAQQDRNHPRKGLEGLSPEQRRQRMRDISKAERQGDITHREADRRRGRVQDSGKVMSKEQFRRDSQQEKQFAQLSPEERRRKMQLIQANPGLTDRQRSARIANLRAAGPIGRRPSRPTPIGTGDAPAPDTVGAFTILSAKFRDYGLASLAPKIQQMLLDGKSSAEIELELQETDEWKQRFAGNEQLRKNGLPVLSVSEYLSVEQSYAQVMKNYGLPSGFYDDPSDFADWIGKSVSPGEVEQRVSQWSDLANREDPAVKQALRERGMSDGDLLAYMMDPGRAAPIIQQKYQSILIGAAARRAGEQADVSYADKLAGMGVTEQQAQQGYGLIAEDLGHVQELGDIYNTRYDQSDFEQEVFENNGDATRKRKRLASQERATFSGSSGVGQGSLRKTSAGSY